MTEAEKKTIEEADWTCTHPHFVSSPEMFECHGQPGCKPIDYKGNSCEGCQYYKSLKH